jgi:hypothetical protein
MKNITFKKIVTFAKYLAIFLLSIDMIALAIPKLLQMQFRMDHIYAFVPLAELPKPELMMAFFGRSYAYNIFIGLTELAIGILIIFKRTRLIGLLISLGVCLNIFIINIEFDLMFEVVRHITMTLSLTLLLLIEYRKDLYKFFIELGGKLNGKVIKAKSGVWKKLRIGYVILFQLLTSFFPTWCSLCLTIILLEATRLKILKSKINPLPSTREASVLHLCFFLKRISK